MSTGAAEANAAATVLVYRLFSCWLIIPAGLAGWLVLRRRGHTPRDYDADDGDERAAGAAGLDTAGVAHLIGRRTPQPKR